MNPPKVSMSEVKKNAFAYAFACTLFMGIATPIIYMLFKPIFDDLVATWITSIGTSSLVVNYILGRKLFASMAYDAYTRGIEEDIKSTNSSN